MLVSGARLRIYGVIPHSPYDTVWYSRSAAISYIIRVTKKIKIILCIFGRCRKIAKNNYSLRHVCLSFSPQRTRLPLEEFSWNLVFEYFSEIYWENLSLIDIRSVLYIKNHVYLWHYLTTLFLEWEMFRTYVVCPKHTSTQFVLKIFSPKNLNGLWNNVVKYCRSREATEGNIIQRMGFAWWINKVTGNVMLISFPQQQCLSERTSLLRSY